MRRDDNFYKLYSKYQVQLISPQYVKPFVRRQKNDGNDAEAICTAVRQPHIPFVPKKTVEQQDIRALHRASQRMVNHSTAVVSQIRGLLLDRGFAIAKSITRARRAIPDILADQDNELTAIATQSLNSAIFSQDLDRRIASFDKKIEQIFRNSEACQRIAKIKGVGPKTGSCRIMDAFVISSCLAELHRSAAVAILLAQLRQLVLPVGWNTPFFDRLLLLVSFALTRPGD
jgi:transposase